MLLVQLRHRSGRLVRTWGPRGLALLLGLCVLYVPTLARLLVDGWQSDQDTYSALILCIAVVLFFRRLPHGIADEGTPACRLLAWIGVASGLAAYFLGRILDVGTLEIGSALPLGLGLAYLTVGKGAIGALWFAFVMLLLAVPPPGALIDWVTQPMKLAVSAAAERVLLLSGYPVSREGAIINIGQYRLLVANACAGIHTVFVLEAVGLLYVNTLAGASLLRNSVMGLAVLPAGFVANVVRIVALAAVTYHLGYEAGQGYLHGLAGVLLFTVALGLLVALDRLITGAAAAWRD